MLKNISFVMILAFSLILIGCAETKVLEEDLPLDQDEVNAEAELLAQIEPSIDQEEARNIVGEAYRSGSYSRPNQLRWLSCVDSDNGKDFENKGIVNAKYSYNRKTYTKTLSDSCQDSNQLLEYYCRDKRYSSTTTKCDYGCKDGACQKGAPTCIKLMSQIAAAIGATCGNGKYDYVADINNDKTVDVLDLSLVGKNIGNEAWCSNAVSNAKNPCKSLKTAEILEIPLPPNMKCFTGYDAFEELPECSLFFREDPECPSCGRVLACPKFHNPVYDGKGVFYPSACWAEQLGNKNYNYGLSDKMLKFISDLWATPSLSGNTFEVPRPQTVFSYSGSGISGFLSGVFLRSSIWHNNSLGWIDYHIFTNYFDPEFENGRNVVTSGSRLIYLQPPYGRTEKALLVFVMFDEAYPENVLLDWTETYESLMNNYFAKK